jgi:hypothetical protein
MQRQAPRKGAAGHVWVAAATLAIATLGLGPASARGAELEILSVGGHDATTTRPPVAALPPELSVPVRETPRLVSVVAADIDADGDIDIVATDGSLNLFVWVNDGTGHLTRQRPSHRSAWRDEPAGPRVDDRAETFQPSTHETAPSMDGPHACSGPAEPSASCGGVRSSGPAWQHLRSRRVPRAPPSTSVLS